MGSEFHDIFFYFLFLYQHKLGGDRIEAFQAVPVDEKNRLRNIGPAREIEVKFKYLLISNTSLPIYLFSPGQLLTTVEEATRYLLVGRGRLNQK